ncbi:MAG: hypothetical protein H7172_11400 [Ferruginibacter sp.]|nr:hypothetical protein [Rhodoferax sp.]
MIYSTEVPPHSLLLRYCDSGYTDCYVTELPFPVTAAQFIEAFYTTPLFKLERLLLSAMLRRPSSDAQAQELGLGCRHSFAIWSVEAREKDQTILAAGRTRSWLSVTPGEPVGTRLFFGTAVVPRHSASGAQAMGFWFWALGAFHRVYSRALLRSARSRLLAQAGSLPGGGA